MCHANSAGRPYDGENKKQAKKKKGVCLRLLCPFAGFWRLLFLTRWSVRSFFFFFFFFFLFWAAPALTRRDAPVGKAVVLLSKYHIGFFAVRRGPYSSLSSSPADRTFFLATFFGRRHMELLTCATVKQKHAQSSTISPLALAGALFKKKKKTKRKEKKEK